MEDKASYPVNWYSSHRGLSQAGSRAAFVTIQCLGVWHCSLF